MVPVIPLLVQDQKWSRERFGDQARFFPAIGHTRENIQVLKRFHAEAASLEVPRIKLFGWSDTARDLRAIYERAARTSR